MTESIAEPTQINRIDLFALARNTHSQNGEDGILEKIFEIDNVARGFFIEFGAWDGMYLSNTYNLYKQGWTGCYIEGDALKYRDLVKNIPDPSIMKINSWVTRDGPTSLDRIVAGLNVPHIDLLSIDIDGDDLPVWKSLRVSRPSVVVIEYNPTIPADVLYENPRDKNHGNSPLSIVKYAASNGYTLVDGTLTNLIFVQNGSKVLDVARLKALEDITRQTKSTKYFFGYDGTLITSSEIAGSQLNELIPVPWTEPICLFSQPLPRVLRGFAPPKAIALFRFVYRMVPSVLFHPRESMRLIRRYWSRRNR